jgi:hypothetical protein
MIKCSKNKEIFWLSFLEGEFLRRTLEGAMLSLNKMQPMLQGTFSSQFFLLFPDLSCPSGSHVLFSQGDWLVLSKLSWIN